MISNSPVRPNLTSVLFDAEAGELAPPFIDDSRDPWEPIRPPMLSPLPPKLLPNAPVYSCGLAVLCWLDAPPVAEPDMPPPTRPRSRPPMLPTTAEDTSPWCFWLLGWEPGRAGKFSFSIVKSSSARIWP